MKEMNKVNIKDLFSSLQQQMVCQLNMNRQYIHHPGSKGDSLENAWIEWLRNYLPARYSVDKAIIIDHEGNTSHQIDIVIYDNWFTPFIFKQNGFHYIPAEGVYAVFEVKPDIQGSSDGKSHIEYAGEKIESVRRLKRTTTSMINSGNQVKARSLTRIIGGILTNTNSFTHEDNKTIKEHLKKLNGLKTIDLGCIADYGSFFVEYEGAERNIDRNKEYSNEDFFRIYKDFYKERTLKTITFSDKESSIISFFLQLSRNLQQVIGTVPAIDFQKYADSAGISMKEEKEQS